jgi:CHAT domain-containing protein
VNAFPQLVDQISSEFGAVAVIDQFALSGDTIYLHTDVSESTKPWCQAILSQWLGPDTSEIGPKPRGTGQGIQARRFQQEILQELERESGRAPFLFDPSSGQPDEGQLQCMREDAQALDERLLQLGTWLFPKRLRAMLSASEVKHVFLSPDPRLFSLPWQALRFEDGTAVVDQPWTLSLVPSALSLYDLVRRRRCIRPQRIVLFAPDKEVNQAAAGDLELNTIRSFWPNSETRVEMEATLAAFEEAAGSAGWIHLRTHGIRSGDVHVPKLYDLPWDRTIQREGHAFPVLISTSCRTGEVLSRGQDIFGMIEIAEQSDIRTVVTPVVSVDGFAAYHWMAGFYDALAKNASVAQAVQGASRRLRDMLPHPAFWGTFICTGDFEPRLK